MKKFYISILTVFVSTFAFGQTQVTFYTNHGNFKAEIYDSLKPITGGNFLTLADTGYYDGQKFYRVIPNFVIQGGSYWGSSTTIPDEFDTTGTLSNIKRTLSMANSGPNTGSSEFFINLKNNTFLDWDKNPTSSAHPVFGYVKDGWNTVDSIAQTPTNSNDAPLQHVFIDSIRITGSYLSADEIETMRAVTQIYPNPISGESVLDVYSDINRKAQLQVYDLTGSLILNTTVELHAGKEKIPLSSLGIDFLSSGTFLFNLQDGAYQFQQKIVKQ